MSAAEQLQITDAEASTASAAATMVHSKSTLYVAQATAAGDREVKCLLYHVL